MTQKLTVEDISGPDLHEEVFAGAIRYTGPDGIEHAPIFNSNPYGYPAFGIRANGTTYWTVGEIPPSEQAVLTHVDGKYYLTRAPVPQVIRH